MQYSTAMVTGGAGFIGSHLVDALVARGVAVTVIDWRDPSRENRNDAAQYVRCDIRSTMCIDVMKQNPSDVVFHLAAHIDDRASVHDPVMNAEHNEIGTLRVLEGAKESGVKHIVFASSCAVYGVQPLIPVSESAVPAPMTPYGISKLAGEYYCAAYRARGVFRATALRFANVYGPRQSGSGESGAVAIFTDRFRAGIPAFVNGDGSTTRDYIHVSDVVAALCAVVDHDRSGVFNVGTGIETSTRDLYTKISMRCGGVDVPAFRPDVRDAVERMALDASALHEACSWCPTIALDDGIQTL